ncbi:MAG: methyltransferase regulatory domain-containing protein [Alphaproteobacteria bacterium]
MSYTPEDDRTDDALRESYDRLPYETRARRKTHPDTLATVAQIFGLAAPVVETARVLEIGCGPGENLVAIATALPRATCVGIDFASTQIDRASTLATSAGAGNAQFYCCDFNEIGDRHAPFDFVIAHGLLSWIPPQRHNELIATCSRCLAPGGLLFLSYNTLPGWHQRRIVRDYLLHETADCTDIGDRVRRARVALSALADDIGGIDWAYGRIIRDERDNVAKLGDSYLAHDLLETFNSAFYFSDVVRHAKTHDLHYVGEAAFDAMVPDSYPASIAKPLKTVTDLQKREQRLDFLINRTFRESIFVKARQTSGRPDQRALAKLFVASSLTRAMATNGDARTVVFRSPSGTEISVEPGTVADALDALSARFPEARSLDEILGDIQPANGPRLESADVVALINALFAAFGRGLISLHSRRPIVRATVESRPLASPLARAQSQEGSRVTTMLLENVDLNDADCRTLLPLLDGRHDVPTLARSLSAADPAESVERTSAALEKMARAGLLLPSNQ